MPSESWGNRITAWYVFRISARWLHRDALGQAGRAAGVHQHHRIGLLRLVRQHGLAARDQVLVAEVAGSVRVVAGAVDQHRVPYGAVVAGKGHRLGEGRGEGLVHERPSVPESRTM